MTRSVDALLTMMLDSGAWLGRRIEAAESLLAYEAPPEHVEAAKAFLTAVFDDPDQDEEFRMKALKLVRKAEARRVVSSTTSGKMDERPHRELNRRMLRAKRRLALMEAGLWPPPKGWDADIANAEPPRGAIVDLSNMAERMEAARLRIIKK
ncbi:hypothetical protein G5V57_09525 [Nordella sp. HKS 07]|uniref:hypothetical protein n=1 Tax=Nordella sp. HKS 07 TaxID=2712222 RepID=UPI0013E118D2|nr:hypothetical protein [Nordella sp. HKS 07]QIG47934.1 hypothetical protein G5V57_09525 [Nordella sp. HKS 07]